MKRKTRVGFLVFSSVLMLTVSGCSQQEPGIAQSRVSSGGDSTATSSSEAPISRDIDPCKLLSADDLAEVGEFQPEYKEGGGARSCFWQRSAVGGGDGFTFAVSVRDAQSLDTMNDLGLGVEKLKVNQRPAAIAKKPKFGDCTLAMKIDDYSRVDVSVPGQDESDDACEVAEIIAGVFEPRLPEIP